MSSAARNFDLPPPEPPDTVHANGLSISRASSTLHANLVSESFRRLISRDFAREHLIVSQGSKEGTEHLAVAESTNPVVIFNVGVYLGSPIEPVVCDDEAIARLIDDAYSQSTTAESLSNDLDDEKSDDVEQLLKSADRDLLSTQGKAPVVKLVDALLFEALGREASDLHLQPLDDRTLVRYRLDGVLQTVREIKPSLTAAVISRIKVMGRMDIADRRIPQDGRATVTINDRSIDLRISTLPTSYGERCVIRLLDNSNHLCDFRKLGMPPTVAGQFLERASGAQGIILITGPTGSGKTTTLYSTLRETGSSKVNIMTIEDPIEYELSTVGLAISQSQVNPRKGVTFATGLRHILRQDPDVIMIGEIRDVEAAAIAIQSSLTGHLVLSTLHTNDAPSAISRLIDFGVEPYLVSSSLSAVLAQRLVRKTHHECDGQGCETCFHTGFRGRTGLFELMSVNDAITDLIAHGGTIREIREAAQTNGLRTLREAGDDLVKSGITTREEVLRVVQGTP